MARLNNLFIIKNGKPERLGSYYYEAIVETRNELFNSIDIDFDRYGELNIIYPLIKANQRNKYLRENKSFFIKAIYKAWDKEQKETFDPWEKDYYDLYLCESDILSITQREEETETKKGCKEFSLNYDIKLTKPIFLAHAHVLKLYKSFEEIPENEKRFAKDLKMKHEELKQDSKKSFLMEKKKQVLEAYENKIKDGFSTYVFTSEKQYTDHFSACCGYYRKETTPEYDRAEKIKEIINACAYGSNKLSIYEVLRILEKLEIKIKEKEIITGE